VQLSWWKTPKWVPLITALQITLRHVLRDILRSAAVKRSFSACVCRDVFLFVWHCVRVNNVYYLWDITDPAPSLLTTNSVFENVYRRRTTSEEQAFIVYRSLATGRRQAPWTYILRTAPWLCWFVVGLWPRRPWFNPRPTHVLSVLGKMVLGQVPPPPSTSVFTATITVQRTILIHSYITDVNLSHRKCSQIPLKNRGKSVDIPYGSISTTVIV
jgi:hypothetical protein